MLPLARGSLSGFLCSPALLTVSPSLWPLVHGCGSVSSLSLFLCLAMSLPLSASHASSLFGVSCHSGSVSFLGPGRGGEQARGLPPGRRGDRGGMVTWPRSGPWLPMPAVLRTDRLCDRPSASAFSPPDLLLHL